MKIARLLIIGLLSLRVLPALAGVEMFDFTGNVNEDRYMALISQLRCLVCQNQSLADSDADLAHDLRVEVYEHMQKGENDRFRPVQAAGQTFDLSSVVWTLCAAGPGGGRRGDQYTPAGTPVGDNLFERGAGAYRGLAR